MNDGTVSLNAEMLMTQEQLTEAMTELLISVEETLGGFPITLVVVSANAQVLSCQYLEDGKGGLQPPRFLCEHMVEPFMVPIQLYYSNERGDACHAVIKQPGDKPKLLN